MIKLIFNKLSLFCILILSQQALAQHHNVDLILTTQEASWKGQTQPVLVVNNQLPAPTLRFKEGDQVTIHVHNKLEAGSSIHWHGILLPWQMDGVEGVTQDAIKPGETFTYSFHLKQSGTYWYHAHSKFQEQQGIYGAIIIDPKEPALYSYQDDHVIVLSDWVDENPESVLSHLKSDGDYYTPRAPLQPSLTKFLNDYQKGTPEEQDKLIASYKMMQHMRMSIYDLADVGYDLYLLNGQTLDDPWTSIVRQGNTIRLRFIGASGSTIYRVKIPGSTFKIIHVQGNDVLPQEADSFKIAPGETTDILLTIKENKPYVIYAESSDTRGKTYGILKTQKDQTVDISLIPPFPEPTPVHHPGMHGMDHVNKDHAQHSMMPSEHMHHGSKNPPLKSTGSKYEELRSPIVTNDPDIPVEEIHMELSGYMDRYMWFINGLAEDEAPLIKFKPGKRYRFIFTNQSMMSHPMHIHGHFFIFRNGHGAHDPLLHTIEVPPGAHIIADVDAEHSGQWFFHCHHLYHMMTGMSRVIQYEDLLNSSPNKNDIPDYLKTPLGHGSHIYQAYHIQLGYDPKHNVQKGDFEYRVGWDRNKLLLAMEEAELKKGHVEKADLDVFYWHLLSQFWAIKGGMNIVFKPSHKTYLQPGIGIEGMAPYFIHTDIRAYLYNKSLKTDIYLERDTLLAHNTSLRFAIRGILATKSLRKDWIGSGLNSLEYTIMPYYSIAPGINLFLSAEFTRYHGNTKKIYKSQDESAKENTYMIGFSWER